VDVVVMVSAVDATRQADPAPYIAAVCRDLEARGVRVADTMVWAARDGRREALLLLQPDEAAFPVAVPGRVRARWNEEDGWSILVGDEPTGSAVYKGLGVVPDPEDVAVWAVVAIAHPELTPSREDHPFRDHSVKDDPFEARLAGYASLS
jgi:hypothetical protein